MIRSIGSSIKCGVQAMLVVACTLGACVGASSPRAEAAADNAPGDTLRGIVAVVGADPFTTVALHGRGGGSTPLEGEDATLRALVGLEVAVRGSAEGRGVFRVASVSVRAHMGVPAIDGILVRRGAGWGLVTADHDTVAITYLPDDLRRSEGVRVWLAGPLDRPPDTSGVIP